MEIEVLDNKVVITLWGSTHESDFEPLVEKFKKADEKEKKRLAIVHFYASYFKDITPKKKEKPYIPSTKEPIEWDDEAQEQLDDILGADPYTMFY